MSTGPSIQTELQKAFITMLFAFAVSVVAQQIAELLIVSTTNWTSPLVSGESHTKSKDQAWALASAGTHSLLSLLMLSVSWIMWSKSQAAGHRTDITDIFSVKFITFLLEVLLVTLYFSLSKSVEGDFSAYSAKGKTIEAYLTPPSARPEAIQMLWIFILFAVWDLIVDVWESATDSIPSNRLKRLQSFFAGIFTYCSVSLICAFGAWIIYKIAPANGLPSQAIFGDAALIALLLLFNRGKVLEHYLFKIFPLQETRKNTKRTPTLRGNLLIGFLFAIYLLCIAAITLSPCFHRS